MRVRGKVVPPRNLTVAEGDLEQAAGTDVPTPPRTLHVEIS